MKSKPKNLCGQRVKWSRLRQGWSADRLATAVTAMGLPMDASAVRRIEARQKKVLDGELLALAKALDTTPHWLVTGREPGHRR